MNRINKNIMGLFLNYGFGQSLELQCYEKALTYVEDGETYVFYINPHESDPDSSVKLYNNQQCLSDNYLAYNELSEVMMRICNGEIDAYSMSEEMEYNYNEFIKE